MKQTLKSSEYADVFYLSEESIGCIKWKKMCSSEEYRSAFEVLLTFQSQTPIENFISDVRNQGIVSPEDRKWFEHVALPKAKEQGLQRAVVITSANPFKQYYLNLILKKTNKYKMPLKLVSSEEKAIEWIASFKLEEADF